MTRTRRLALAGGITALAAVFLLGGLTVLRGTPFGFDTEWMAEITEHRSELWLVPSLVMNFVGGGWFAIWVVPLGGAVLLFLAGRRWAALYFVLVSALSAGAVQLLKALFGRARPEDILVHVDPGSFPSGHVANAATVAVALALIFQRTWLWVLAVAWIVLMALSRTYLGAHWVSDTVGGAVLGAAAAVLLWALLATRIHPLPPAVARARSGGSDSQNRG
jgi:undecaprenyl-diphosphatase